MKNHTFPKRYTTAGAAYRAKKIYTERFPEQSFGITKQEGMFILTSTVKEQQVTTVTETVKPKVTMVDDDYMIDEFDGGLFDDEPFYTVEDQWDN